METPATPVASPATMIAIKRAVMIDELSRAITDFDESESGVAAPVTCSTCHMTYLPSAVPPSSTPRADWVCAGCQQPLG